MKSILLVFVISVAMSCVAFYAGFLHGEFNGRLEQSARDTGPLMNLLLARAGMEKDLIEMNREQLYIGVDVYDALRQSWRVTRKNKALLDDRILVAKDYWQAVGGTVLQTDAQKKESRQGVDDIQALAGIPMTRTVDGVKVSPGWIEEKDRRIAALFSKYSDRKSSLHDFITGMVNQAKKKANQ
jgi:hypothetical protein